MPNKYLRVTLPWTLASLVAAAGCSNSSVEFAGTTGVPSIAPVADTLTQPTVSASTNDVGTEFPGEDVPEASPDAPPAAPGLTFPVPDRVIEAEPTEPPFVGPTQTPTPVAPIVVVTPTPAPVAPIVVVTPTPAPQPIVVVTPTPAPTPTADPGQTTLMQDEGPLCAFDQPGFGGKVFKVPTNSRALPTVIPAALAQVDAPELWVERRWTEGFPGLPADLTEWFGLRLYGVFYLPAKTTLRFWLRSDDGAKLYIDNAIVINNDGIHPASNKYSDYLTLEPGYHKIAVDWFQGPKYSIALKLQVAFAPNYTWTRVDSSSIRHSDICDLPHAGSFE